MVNSTDLNARQGLRSERENGELTASTNVTDAVVQLVGWEAPVHQATGMIAAQLDCDIVSAAHRLAEHARITGQELPEVARDVLTRRKRFA